MKELFYPLSEIISEELLTDHNYYNSCYQSEVKLFPGIAITSLTNKEENYILQKDSKFYQSQSIMSLCHTLSTNQVLRSDELQGYPISCTSKCQTLSPENERKDCPT